MNDILKECIVTQFYKQRIGFFAVIAAIAFGVLTGREHTYIAETAIANLPFLGVICLFWLGYSLMVWSWIRHHLSLPEYRFIFSIRTVPFRERVRYFLQLGIYLQIPVLLYAAFILSIGLRKNAHYPVSILAVYVSALIVSTGLVIEWIIRNPVYKSNSLQRQILNFNRPVSFTFWILEWLLRERTLTLMITKVASSILIAATMLYYQTGEYDIRLPALGLSLATMLNAGLSTEIFFWQNRQWAWIRSLPVPSVQYIQSILKTHILLLIPELLLTWRYGFSSLYGVEIIQLNLLSVSLILGIHARIYWYNRQLEDLIRKLFWLYILLTFVILYKTNLLFIAIIVITLAGIIYKKRSPYSRTPPE